VFGIALAMATLASCFEENPPPTDGGLSDGGVPGPAAARADYASTALWDAPWPDERLRGADGRVRFAFPTRRDGIVRTLGSLIEGAAGFGTSSPIYFPLDAAIDASTLPSPHDSLAIDQASVLLVDVDPASPERGRALPIVVGFEADLGPYGVPNVLGVLPFQGRPLHGDRLYAAVVTTRVRALDGSPLRVAPSIDAVLRGQRPEGLSEAAFAAHRTAVEALVAAGLPSELVASLAVFRTWDPMAELAAARAQVIAEPLPTPDAPFEAREVFDEYCVYHTTIRMPVYQTGQAPYATEGGSWARDPSGRLVRQRDDTSNVWVTIPRRAMPESGFPTAVFVRTGGGGDRPLVDRGPRTEGGTSEPGSGPAVHFARAGFVGVSVDGPLGGLRNLENWDEQFAIFNINNPQALRDTIRQSALELALLAHVLPELSIGASACPDLRTPSGDGVVRLDTSRLAIMGHSMGATIAPLAVAVEPAYRALILSGAGGSWIENVLHKRSPLDVRPIAEALLGYTNRTLTPHDPALALLQWAGEPADPQVYARAIVDAPTTGEPRHVLMFQGILDTYIPPPVANALSLAMGLDLGGDGLDETLPEYEPLGRYLDLAGSARVPLPVRGNRIEGSVTAVVVQHREDGIEDGHEVVYQTAPPQLQYRCFLQGLVGGVPSVAPSDGAACP
jgi:hypothetical protein